MAVSPDSMDWRLWAESAADHFNVLNPMHLGSTSMLFLFAVDALYWNPNVPCSCDVDITPRLAELVQDLGLLNSQVCHFVQNVHAHASQFYLGSGRPLHSPTGHADEAYIMTLDDALRVNETVCLGHEPIMSRVQKWLSNALVEWTTQRIRFCIPCDESKVDKIIAAYETSASATLNGIVSRAACAHDTRMRACVHVQDIRSDGDPLMVVDVTLKVKKE